MNAQRWAWAQIDLGALRRNVATLAAHIAPQQLWAVVKADAYGHGAVECARVALQSVSAKSDPTSSLAARFAVREATMKALGVGLGAFDLHDVSVTKLTSGQPTLRIEGRAKQLADARGITSWQVSISHTDSVAIAVVAAE